MDQKGERAVQTYYTPADADHNLSLKDRRLLASLREAAEREAAEPRQLSQQGHPALRLLPSTPEPCPSQVLASPMSEAGNSDNSDSPRRRLTPLERARAKLDQC